METTNNDRAIMELIIRLFQFELECSEEKYVKLALQTAKKMIHMMVKEGRYRDTE